MCKSQIKNILSNTSALLALSIVCLTSIDSAFAKIDDNQLSNTENYLRNTNNFRLVKHSFQLHIPKSDRPLSLLIIEAPSTVAVSNDIEVIDSTGHKVNIDISAKGKKIIIDFPKKVISNTKLLVNLNRVRQPVSGADSVYKLSAKVVGSDSEILIGIATFKTF